MPRQHATSACRVSTPRQQATSACRVRRHRKYCVESRGAPYRIVSHRIVSRCAVRAPDLKACFSVQRIALLLQLLRLRVRPGFPIFVLRRPQRVSAPSGFRPPSGFRLPTGFAFQRVSTQRVSASGASTRCMCAFVRACSPPPSALFCGQVPAGPKHGDRVEGAKPWSPSQQRAACQRRGLGLSVRAARGSVRSDFQLAAAGTKGRLRRRCTSGSGGEAAAWAEDGEWRDAPAAGEMAT